MKKHNSNNERIKRKYYIFLKEAKRQNEASIDQVAKAVSRFETYTNYRDFKQFHFEQAIRFKKHLSKQKNQKTGKPLSKATLHATFRHLKGFFQWLAMQSGYKSKINYTDTEYFNLSEKDTRIATARRQRASPTLEQIKHTINTMPANTEIERRNRALIAFTLLTGARDSAIASMKIKHIDLLSGFVNQDAREVKTKFSKSFKTFFFPVGDDILEIFRDWVDYLKTELLFGNDDPLFPKTKVINGENKTFQTSGLTGKHWSNASPIRTIFREAFCAAGLPYFNPHSFRNTLTNLCQKLSLGAEKLKAWSQNLGHNSVLTTLCSYGTICPSRQAEIFQRLRAPQKETHQEADSFARAVAKEMLSLNAGS